MDENTNDNNHKHDQVWSKRGVRRTFFYICNAAYEHQLYLVVFSLITLSNIEIFKNAEPPYTSIYELKQLSISQIVAIAHGWLSCWQIWNFQHHSL